MPKFSIIFGQREGAPMYRRSTAQPGDIVIIDGCLWRIKNLEEVAFLYPDLWSDWWWEE